MRPLLLSLALVTALVGPRPAGAALSGRAVPGDNCTPYNGYAVGYPITPETQKSRIANQSTVLADGWKAFGWIVTTRSGTAWFVPYPPFFTGKSDAGTVPPLLLLKSPDVASIRVALNTLARNPFWLGVRLSMPSRVLISHCYSAADGVS